MLFASSKGPLFGGQVLQASAKSAMKYCHFQTGRIRCLFIELLFSREIDLFAMVSFPLNNYFIILSRWPTPY